MDEQTTAAPATGEGADRAEQEAWEAYDAAASVRCSACGRAYPARSFGDDWIGGTIED